MQYCRSSESVCRRHIIIPLVRKNGDLYVKKISYNFFGINGSFSRA